MTLDMSFCKCSRSFLRHLIKIVCTTIKFVCILLKKIGNEVLEQMSCLMGKPTICICENKDADQLRGNREADQRLCFRYSDSTIPPLLNSKISSF